MTSLHALTVMTERVIALAVLLQTIELWQVRSVCADTGVWRFALLRGEYAGLPAPLRWSCERALPYRPYQLLLVLRAVCACAVLFAGATVVMPALCVTQIAICIRFRGTFNGGSDAMTLVVLLASSCVALSQAHPTVSRAALLYIAVQSTLSYAIAGGAKILHADWRSGRALAHFVTSSPYAADGPAWYQRWLNNPRVCALLAWLVLLFECLFPLAWLSPAACLGFVMCGFGFHLVNAWVFGLNRFVLAWAATYPGLVYGSLVVREWMVSASP